VLFIAYLDILSLIVLLTSSVSTYYLLKEINPQKKAVLLVATLLTILFVFYKINIGLGNNQMIQSALPLGMSYYILRQLHFTIEVYKGNWINLKFQEFMSYMLFLPVILVGPINRIDDWQRELRRRRWNPEMFSMGLERILYGLVKIVVFGNYAFSYKLGMILDSLTAEQIWLRNYLSCLQYAGNSYMQFAGYSDIAIGLSLLMGIRIIENFNYPFLARNINDFWQRWHISLSQWCKDYIFMTIASSTRKPWIAIIISMIVLGLWHELSSRYLLWALFHGFGIVIWHFFNKYIDFDLKGASQKIWVFFSILITLNFVIISFAWIKEDSVIASINVFKVLFGF